MVVFYSLITILLIVVVGVVSLVLWYWNGRRPLKHT